MAESEFTEPKSGNPKNESGGEFVSLSRKQKRTPTAEGPAESVNLVSFFTEDERTKIGERCYDDYVGDVRSRQPRMKRLKQYIEMHVGLLKEKNWPFNKCANVSLPTLTTPILQVQARLFDMVWPENGKVITSAPATPDDYERAYLTELFANSYIRHKMPEMGLGLDDTLFQMCLFGSAFRRTYWDEYEGRVRSDWIPIEDFVVPYWRRSSDPSMRDVPRYTLLQHMTIFDLEAYGDQGIYENVEGLRAEDADGTEGKEDTQVSDALKKIDGTDESPDTSSEDKARMVLEQYREWRLPSRGGKHVAFDGKAHPVIVTVDAATKRVLRVVLREEDDPDDAKRFQREAQAYQEYLIQAQAHAQAQQQLQQAAAMGTPPQVDPATGMPAPPPQEPAEVKEPKPQRKRPISFFTHWKAFPSEGFYGTGFGDFLYPLSKAVNTLINQHIDGVTLRNAKPGFISRTLRGARGAVNVQPGELVEVDAPASVVRDGVVWMDPPQNDPTTMPLASFLKQDAQALAGTGDIMSGQTSGANRTAKEVQILNTQVMKQITILSRRAKEAFRHDMDKMWRCWGVFLPDEDIVDVVSPSGAPKRIKIGRDMFVPDARVMPASDPRMRFEKIEESQQLYQFVQANPMLAQNPMVMRAITEEILMAQNGEKLIEALGPPPAPPPPPQPKQHWEEESGWLKDEDPPVLPPDNDHEHMQAHQAFLGSPHAQLMTKDQREKAEHHMRLHGAQMITKAFQQPPQGPPGGPPPGPQPEQFGTLQQAMGA